MYKLKAATTAIYFGIPLTTATNVLGSVLGSILGTVLGAVIALPLCNYQQQTLFHVL